MRSSFFGLLLGMLLLSYQVADASEVECTFKVSKAVAVNYNDMRRQRLFLTGTFDSCNPCYTTRPAIATVNGVKVAGNAYPVAQKCQIELFSLENVSPFPMNYFIQGQTIEVRITKGIEEWSSCAYLGPCHGDGVTLENCQCVAGWWRATHRPQTLRISSVTTEGSGPREVNTPGVDTGGSGPIDDQPTTVPVTPPPAPAEQMSLALSTDMPNYVVGQASRILADFANPGPAFRGKLVGYLLPGGDVDRKIKLGELPNLPIGAGARVQGLELYRNQVPWGLPARSAVVGLIYDADTGRLKVFGSTCLALGTPPSPADRERMIRSATYLVRSLSSGNP